MSWYGELFDWLEEQREHDRDLQAAYEEGRRRGELAAGLMWPILKRQDAVEAAYREGVHAGLLAAQRNAERGERHPEEGAA